MAAALRPPPADLTSLPPGSVAARLFTDGPAFDFFQAVRLLARLAPDRRPVGRAGPAALEVVRFRVHRSLAFPASAVHDIRPPDEATELIGMAVTFLGLTGPSGALPRHYTQRVLRQALFGKSPEERYALRDWLDLFNHRLISLFYRAWEKYRFYLPYEREEFAGPTPDAFTLALYSLVGLGTPGLQSRLKVITHVPDERLLARFDDLGVLRFAGFFAHRPRNAVSLEALLRGLLRVPVKVRQFVGQWLHLEPANQSAVTAGERNNQLGWNVIVGDRIWDVQSKVRVELGPLTYAQFVEFLPDRTATEKRKAVFLLAQLIRLYVGPEVDVDIQPVLRADDVPACRLGAGDGLGTRLGWNTWSHRDAMTRDAADAVFPAEDATAI
jgi:type VI secretion system protein ImpH